MEIDGMVNDGFEGMETDGFEGMVNDELEDWEAPPQLIGKRKHSQKDTVPAEGSKRARQSYPKRPRQPPENVFFY